MEWWCWWLAIIIRVVCCGLGRGHSNCCGLGSLCSSCSQRQSCNGYGGAKNRTVTQAAESVKYGDHSRRMAAIRFYLLSRRQFSAHTKSSRSHIDKRTAWATGNTRYRYSKIACLDHKMADNCVSLARTNTVSSTITKPIKTRKTSNKSYSYNLLNRINKMYTRLILFTTRVGSVACACL